MKHQNINVIENSAKLTLNLGRQGEYNVRDVIFDMSDFQQKYGDGTATIVHYPANGSAYTVPSISGDSKDSAVLDSDNILTWTIGRLATMHNGYGVAEITWLTADGLKKSIRYDTYCKESIGDYGTDRAAQQSYIDQMVELASTITDLSSEFSDAERIAAEISDARENAVSDIETLESNVIGSINNAKSESIEDIGDSKESALDALNTAKQTALSDVESAKQDAETDINAAILIAETHANNASQSATNASNSATSASNSADSASQSATSAQASATNASNSATNASQFADNASSSASSAGQSATSAQTSATNASTSEQNARQAAEDAQDILESVQAEGDTQIGRVQAKGDEIIASLPDDFTQVQNDIATLNGSLDTLKADLGELSSVLGDYAEYGGTSGYVWVDNQYPSGTVITWENKGSNNILIGHYAADKTTRYGANTVITPGQTANVTIPNGDVAYIAIYYYGVSIAAMHLTKGVFKDISDVSENAEALFNTVSSEIKNIQHFTNLFDDAETITNANLNYNTGAITSGGSRTLKKVSVKPDSVCYFNQLSQAYMYICLYDSNMAFINNLYAYEGNTGNWNRSHRLPSNCYYVVAWVSDDYVNSAFFCYYDDLSKLKAGYNRTIDNSVYTNDCLSYITIGTGGEFATVKEGLEYAVANNKGAIILPGIYNLVSEGISGIGYNVPRKVYGYGAILLCRLASENWNLSALNIIPNSRGSEIYGLTIICANCRYCVHDDMGRSTETPFYHNVYKDCVMVHESAASEVLIAPQCIGGGFGDTGYIDIDSCVFSATMREVTYHSLATNPERVQTGNCTVFAKNSVFDHTINLSGHGTFTDYMNTLYVTGCLLGTVPQSGAGANVRTISWGNTAK